MPTISGNAKTDNDMNTNNDTICAISTAPGIGGIAVARVSGREAIAICDKLWEGKALGDAASHTAHLGYVRDENGERLDQAVATLFRAPRSFTGEDTVEISVHGSAYIQRELIHALCAAGARLAEAGEFTRRAFSSGRFDLAQAEAVADIISADSRASHRLAVSQMRGDFSAKLNGLHDSLLELVSLLELELDFSEEDVEFASRAKLRSLAADIRQTVDSLASSFRTGDAIKRGVSVAIVGETNAGKSTLLNRLLHDDRAIVSDVHGTTRDVIEDTIDIDGVCFRFIDTAGLRKTDDTVEAMGISRTFQRLSTARVILWIIDASRPETIDDTAAEIMSRKADDSRIVAVINKCDIADAAEARRRIAGIYSGSGAGADLSVRMGASEGMGSGDGAGLGVSHVVEISADKAIGIDALEALLVQLSGAKDISASDVIVTNARHYNSLISARDSIDRAIDGIDRAISGDFIAQDLRETLHHLSTITGTITTTDILANIFSKFCIGK